MSGWKLWTSVASGVLSVGGGSTYYVWNRTPAANSTQVTAAGPEAASPHAVPPSPIPDTLTDPSTPQFATPVSFNEPPPDGTTNGTGVRASDDRSGFSPRSRFQAPPSDSAPSQLPSDIPSDSLAPQTAGRYQPSYSEQAQQPEPGTTNDVAVDDLPRGDPGDPRGDPSAISALAAAPPTEVAVAEEPPFDPNAPAEAPRVLAEPPPTSSMVTPETTSPITSGDVASETSAEPKVETAAEPPPAAAIRSTESGSFARPISPRSGAPGSRSNLAAPAADPAETAAPRRSPGPRISPLPTHQAVLVSNAPGERRLEGIQAPSLTIERSAPEEIQVGKPTKFVIKVRNVGQVAAQGVTVSDQVPNGTRFVAATPETMPAADGTLIWEVGTLESGEDAILTVELMPEAEGEIGSVAEVTFRAQAAVRTIATKPLLKVEQAGPAKALIGEDVTFQIAVSNPGTGVATGVVVEVDVPDGLAHDGGREIMTDPFDLRPNETRSFDLVLRAVEPGIVPNLVRAVGSGTLVAEHRSQLEIVAPQLVINTVGPSRRFLDRPVKYQIVVSNPGTAPAKNIELVAHLPRGLKFTAADMKGRYDQGTHAVAWSLEELPVGEQGVVELTAIPTDIGEQKLHIEGRASLGLEHRQEHTTVVEDITNLAFTVSNESVPIEVGSETTYQIRVANNGTKVARNVRLAVQIPAGLEVVDSDGPTKIQQQGDQLVVQAIAELGQREEAVYRLVTKGTRPGDHVLRVQLLCDEFTTPVTKEEITKVYADK